MSDQPQSPQPETAPAGAGEIPPGPATQAASAAEDASSTSQADGRNPADKLKSTTDTLKSTADERPELVVGAAFAGGFVLAMILKRLGH